MGFLQILNLQLLNILLAAFLECKAGTPTSCKHAPSGTNNNTINCAKGDYVSISCLTTSHHPNEPKVKLRRTSSNKDILHYPDAASLHQRWSVKTDAENVTLDLKDITLSDAGQYECEVHNNGSCFTTLFHLKVKECKVLDPVCTTSNSSVTLTCSDHVDVMWEVVQGDKSTNITQYSCKHSESTKGAQKPLCERARTYNGSMLIRDVVNSDASWYRCRWNKTSCYDVKLLIKDCESFHSTTVLKVLSTTPLATDSAVNSVDQSEDGSVLTAAVTSVLSVCVVISLIVCVILYLKKRKSKTNSQIQLRRNSLYFFQDSEMYYSEISDGLQSPLYHLVNQNNPGSMTTFGAEQRETTACEHANQPITKFGY